MRRRWQAWPVLGAWLDAARRQVRIFFRHEDGERAALVFLLRPSAGQAVEGTLLPEPPDHAVGWHPFRRLRLSDVRAPADERLLVLELAGGLRDVHGDRPPVYRLYLELHSNQWNALLVRGTTGRIERVLWPRTAGGRSLRPGAPYEPLEGAREWGDTVPTQAGWEERLRPLEPGERRAVLLSTAAWASSINVDWILGPAARETDAGLLEAALERYRQVRRAADEAWLLDPEGAAQPYPVRVTETAVRCDTVLQAMALSAARSGTWPPAAGEHPADGAGPFGTDAESAADARALGEELERRLRKVRKRRAALQRQLRGDDAERLRELAHLILARQADIPRGAASMVLEGFDGRPVELQLDPRLDAVQNADELYEKARRRERAVAGLPARIREAGARLAELEAARAALAESGPSDALWTVVGGRLPEPGDRARVRRATPSAAPLPYRRFRSSGGLEIRVGRSSRGNDDLTFRHSSPEDIWLHARQGTGAHVILRWDRRDQRPPHADLVEAATLAAVHSEARHSGLVAVDWTRRKYVRKPRKAPAGTVVPERVSTLFVEPDPEIGRRLSIED